MVCSVCGNKIKKWVFRKILSEELIKEWDLTEEQAKQFNLRESQFCPHCKNSFRTRTLAEGIMKKIPFRGAHNFLEWCSYADKAKMKVAEINSCGNLHKAFKKISLLTYSEYQPEIFNRNMVTFGKNVLRKLLFRYSHEDITNLTLKSNTYDLVVHSETLEHVVNIKKALHECARILKPTGSCIFTVPIIPERKTLQKVRIDKNGELIYVKSPSYHGYGNRSDYLVVWEFGKDFIKNNKLMTLLSEPKFMTWVFCITKRYNA